MLDRSADLFHGSRFVAGHDGADDHFDDIFAAHLTGSTYGPSGEPIYSYTEQSFDPATGTLVDALSPRQGDFYASWAREENDQLIPTPCYVWLRFRCMQGPYPVYEFQSPFPTAWNNAGVFFGSGSWTWGGGSSVNFIGTTGNQYTLTLNQYGLTVLNGPPITVGASTTITVATGQALTITGPGALTISTASLALPAGTTIGGKLIVTESGATPARVPVWDATVPNLVNSPIYIGTTNNVGINIVPNVLYSLDVGGDIRTTSGNIWLSASGEILAPTNEIRLKVTTGNHLTLSLPDVNKQCLLANDSNDAVYAVTRSGGVVPGVDVTEAGVVYTGGLRTSGALGALNTLPAPTGDLSLAGHKLTNVASPTAGTDAANKNYVDAASQGIDWKNSARAASTANVNVASAPSSIDGVTLASGDRVLLKNQTTASENGLYTFAAAGSALTRATDADTSAKVTSGLAVFVSEGTAGADTAWILTTADPITLGTTSLTFAQFGSGTAYSAGSGLTLTGTTFSVSTSYAGQTSINTLGTITAGAWQATVIAQGYGGTGFNTYTTGDILYSSATNTLSKLAANTTATKKLLSMTSSVPSWSVLAAADLPVMVAAGASHAAGAMPDPGATAHTNWPYYAGDDAVYHKPLGALLGSSYVSTDQTTTSTSYVDLATADSVTFTLDVTSDVLVLFLCETYSTIANDTTNSIVNLDGTDQTGTGTQTTIPTASGPQPGYATAKLTSLATGSHTIKIRHRLQSGGTGTAHFLCRSLSVFLAG